MGASLERPCTACGEFVICKAGEEDIHDECRERRARGATEGGASPSSSTTTSMEPAKPIDPDAMTIEELRAREVEISRELQQREMDLMRAEDPPPLLEGSGQPRPRGKVQRDPFGDTEDLGAMMEARDRIEHAQKRLGPHLLSVAVKDAALQLTGAIGLLGLSIIIAATIVASCGGN